MIKKIIRTLIILISFVSIIGCTNDATNKESNTSENNIDQEFVQDMEKSIKSRWEVIDGASEVINDEEELNHLEKLVKAESDILYRYKELEFNDPKLGKLATDYINGVEVQEKALDYYNRDIFEMYEKWDEGIDIRSVALTKLVDDYGVEVDENAMAELRKTSQLVEEEEETEKEINKMMEKIEFTQEEDEFGWKEFTSVVNNTTDITFDSFEINIKLVDDAGVTVGQEYAYADNWEPGEKVKFEFMTDESFKELDWSWNYYIN